MKDSPQVEIDANLDNLQTCGGESRIGVEGGPPKQEAGRLVVDGEEEAAARVEVGELSSTGKKAELATMETLEMIQVDQVAGNGYSDRCIVHGGRSGWVAAGHGSDSGDLLLKGK